MLGIALGSGDRRDVPDGGPVTVGVSPIGTPLIAGPAPISTVIVIGRVMRLMVASIALEMLVRGIKDEFGLTQVK
jgi:small neutral amino acid transporter SnatA (MarC family)